MTLLINETIYLQNAIFGIGYPQLLTWNFLLLPVFVAIWAFFIEKDLTSKMKKLNETIEDFKKTTAEDILISVKNALKEKQKEKAVDIIKKEIDTWKLINDCIGDLENGKKSLYDWAKATFSTLAGSLFLGFLTSMDPSSSLLGITIISLFQLMFCLSVFVLVYWIHKIITYTHKLNTVVEKGEKGLKEIVDQYKQVIESSK